MDLLTSVGLQLYSCCKTDSENAQDVKEDRTPSRIYAHLLNCGYNLHLGLFGRSLGESFRMLRGETGGVGLVRG